MAHGARAHTTAGFSAARFALGLGESGNFPASIKTVAEWFPARERAFATGIFNAGSNVGAIITPIVVPWITLTLGLAGGVHRDGRARIHLARRLAADLSAARRSIRSVSPAELAYIRSDPIEPCRRCAGRSCCATGRRGHSRSGS